ncbi:hypothetical protein GF312_22200 [Candidatus Poribacteria bacterium]|nr:hypothetical protein [Candidatus Poribacteria bacterium]
MVFKLYLLSILFILIFSIPAYAQYFSAMGSDYLFLSEYDDNLWSGYEQDSDFAFHESPITIDMDMLYEILLMLYWEDLITEENIYHIFPELWELECGFW